MSRKPLDYDEAEARYIAAIKVRDWLNDAYKKSEQLPQLRKKIRATLKSAAGAVNNARRFYEAAAAARIRAEEARIDERNREAAHDIAGAYGEGPSQ